METEIKLALRPEDLARVPDLACLRRYCDGPAHTRTFFSCYYDTPDGELVQRRVWLRTRSIDGDWLQTVKMAGDVVGGLHQRFEHEVAIEGPAPDVKALPDLNALSFLSKKSLWKSLKGLIETEFDRTTWDVALEDGTCVEFVMDVGEIRAAGRSRALCELELELKSGNTMSMMQFARAIADEMDVGLDSISKAHKGLLLIEERTPGPVFARTHAVAPDATLIDLAQAGIISSFAHIQGNVDPILESGDIEGVHQMRVGMRRLRAAMWGFKKALPGLKRPPFFDDLKWLLSLLAPARELDVMVSTCLARLEALFEPPEGLAQLRSVATHLEHDAYSALRDALRSPRCRRLMLDLLVWVHEADWAAGDVSVDATAPGSAADYARRQLRRGHRRIMNAGDGIELLSEVELHQLRIMIKRQRYTAEFVASLFKGSSVAYLKSLKRMQTALGTIQDAHVVPQSVERMLGSSAHITQYMRGWCAHAAEDARHDLLRLWGAFEQAPRFWKK